MNYEILTCAATGETLAEWNRSLDGSTFSAHYTSPAFLHEHYFLAKHPFAILARDGNAVRGVVTGYLADSDMICGTPGSPHVCVQDDADPDAVGAVLAAGLRAHAANTGSSFISAFSWSDLAPFRSLGFKRRVIEPPMCTILLDLSKGKDELFRQCSETRRNKIRRAIKGGVQVTEMDVLAEFDEYYELYRHWCAYKEIPCQPYDIQRATFLSVGNRLALVARYEKEMVGVSTFRYRRRGLVEYAANVSRREESSKFRQNDLLLWRGIEWAVEQGCFTRFSMAGAHFFLQKFGGSMHISYRYTRDRTVLRRRDTMEGARLAALRVYKALPPVLQRTAKRVIKGSVGDGD
jgi:hypothetical protein